MVFANLIFLYLFLPLNILLYFISKNKAYRNIVLVAFSLFFYAWGEPVWIFLLIFTTLAEYLFGLWIEHGRGTVWAKVSMVLSLVLCFGLLGVFKYGDFIIENINQLLGTSIASMGFTLPIGISFYTFQIASYLVDVYRGEVAAQRSFVKFLLFVSLYPQLVAGPIVRYSHIADEIDNRKISPGEMQCGISRFCIGLAKKVIIANVAGDFVQRYMGGDLAKLSVAGAWFGVIMFTIQIYFDFSGYSDMAIGMGWMFGFHYYENFNYPYIAKSATEFWRRWHISLGSFFRDYVYIPMGGNRKHQYFNLFVVWFLTGLWHGASWNFILWGIYFGVLISIERLFLSKVLKKIPAVFSHLYLMLMVVIGWALFYFTDLGKLGTYLSIMFGGAGRSLWDLQLEITLANNVFWIILAVVFCLPIVPKFKNWMQTKLSQGKQLSLFYVQIGLNLVLLVVSTAMLVGQSYNPFLYFRF